MYPTILLVFQTKPIIILHNVAKGYSHNKTNCVTWRKYTINKSQNIN